MSRPLSLKRRLIAELERRQAENEPPFYAWELRYLKGRGSGPLSHYYRVTLARELGIE